MDLFTYLMNKNGNNLVDSNQMFEYLLNKAGKQKEATGTEINITDVTIENIIKLTLDKESSQEGTPTPENPVEVKTVKGYRNLLDTNKSESGGIDASGNLVNNPQLWRGNEYIEVNSNQDYTFTNIEGLLVRFYQYDENKNFISPRNESGNNNKKFTITTGANTKYIKWSIYNNGTTLTESLIETYKLQIVGGNQELPYVPYGTNWVYVKVSNGTDTNYYTIPLNNNEIVGIGDYKDELIIDNSGHCWLNKKIKKLLLNGAETGGAYTIVVSRETTTYFDIRYYGFKSYTASQIPLGFCNRLLPKTGNELYTGGTEGFTFITSNNPRISLLNTRASTVAELREWLSNNNLILYGVAIVNQLIDLNYNVDIRLFNGVNNITNSDDMNMTLIYK